MTKNLARQRINSPSLTLNSPLTRKVTKRKIQNPKLTQLINHKIQ